MPGAEVACRHCACGEIKPKEGCGCRSIQKLNVPPLCVTYPLYKHLPHFMLPLEQTAVSPWKSDSDSLWGARRVSRSMLGTESDQSPGHLWGQDLYTAVFQAPGALIGDSSPHILFLQLVFIESLRQA